MQKDDRKFPFWPNYRLLHVYLVIPCFYDNGLIDQNILKLISLWSDGVK